MVVRTWSEPICLRGPRSRSAAPRHTTKQPLSLSRVNTLPQGRFTLSAIMDLATRLIAQRNQFGLTPSARCRIDAGSTAGLENEIDDAIFNQKAQLLVLPKPG